MNDGSSLWVAASDDDGLGPLMRATQAGDAKACATLLERVAFEVRHIVRHQPGFAEAEEVEDLVQDVLLSVHGARGTYDAKRPFMPWLTAIIRHRLADTPRRNVRRPVPETSISRRYGALGRSAKRLRELWFVGRTEVSRGQRGGRGPAGLLVR